MGFGELKSATKKAKKRNAYPSPAETYYDGDCMPDSDMPDMPTSNGGLFVFYVGVGDSTPAQAMAALDAAQERYKHVVGRLQDRGCEVMWFPTRQDSRTEFFQLP
jgi:hypothetical protein